MTSIKDINDKLEWLYNVLISTDEFMILVEDPDHDMRTRIKIRNLIKSYRDTLDDAVNFQKKLIEGINRTKPTVILDDEMFLNYFVMDGIVTSMKSVLIRAETINNRVLIKFKNSKN